MPLESQTFLRSLFDAAVAAADPLLLLPGRLPSPPVGRTVVIGAGKAAARMARAVELEWAGPIEGLVVTRYGHGELCKRIRVVEAAHPLPDAAGQEATVRILQHVRDLTPDDLVVCLLSGGGSALLESLPAGITLDELRTVGRALLRSGAGISEINCVRKHLSLVKGGRLAAAAHPARVATYVISDVPGDDPSVIASGPTVPDPTTFADALAILERYGIAEPAPVLHHLRAGAAAVGSRAVRLPGQSETPKPGDPSFARDEVVVLATAHSAVDAAARVACAAGVEPVVLGHALEGEARELGRAHAELACTCASGRGLATAPCVLLSGGETTVAVSGRGRGGRNTEYLLGLALGLQGATGISAIAADTDGIDGTEDNAGAFLTPGTLELARAAGLDAAVAQASNDAYGFFAAAGGLLVIGPTRTNVNDLRAVLVQTA
ncbi:MAG TPA: glycerate kinase [Thermoleophilia bacterium]|nr:glycerate kinase [Thermoleophilia bacterium]